MTKPTIHHMIRKQADKAGVMLKVEGDRIIAIDIQTPNQEFSGTDAKKMLEMMLNRRTEGGAAPVAKAGLAAKVNAAAKKMLEKAAKPKTPKPADDEDGDEDGEEDGDEGEEVTDSGTVVKAKYKQQYALTDDTCGDAFADAFRVATSDDGKLDLEAMANVASANGVDLARWAHLNNGLKRMNLGNVLRGLVSKGTDVVIGTAKFKGEPQVEKVKKADPTKPIKAVRKAKADVVKRGVMA